MPKKRRQRSNPQCLSTTPEPSSSGIRQVSQLLQNAADPTSSVVTPPPAIHRASADVTPDNNNHTGLDQAGRQDVTTIKGAGTATIQHSQLVSALGNIYIQGTALARHDGSHAIHNEDRPDPPPVFANVECDFRQKPDYDIYYDQLLIKGRGAPLWVPGPNMRLPKIYRRSGVRFGDVGILYRSGGFDFLFNILLPANHEINKNRVPEGFRHLDKLKIENNSIQESVVYDRGSWVGSSSLRRMSIVNPGFTFGTTDKEGSILVMPEGALSQDLLNVKMLQRYIAEHANSWYEYVGSEACGREVENGDIRVVVGFDKVSSWGIATFASNVEEQLQFELKSVNNGAAAQTYLWESVNGRVGPAEKEMEDIRHETDTSPLQNQCVFLRTLNFSLSGKILEDKLAVSAVRSSHVKNIIPHSLPNRWDGEPSQSQLNSQPDEVTFRNAQYHSPVLHPSKLLNQRLLEEYPNAKMVITRDSDWISVLSENDSVFPDKEELCARILRTHDVCEEDGILTLKQRTHMRRLIKKLFQVTGKNKPRTNRPLEGGFLSPQQILPGYLFARRSTGLQTLESDAERIFLDVKDVRPQVTKTSSSDIFAIQSATESPDCILNEFSGIVTSGTLQGLVKFLVDNFGYAGHTKYRDILLMGCCEFATPYDLFQVLSSRFYTEEEEDDIEKRVIAQYNVIRVISDWLESPYFRPTQQLLYQMRNFCEDVAKLRSTGTLGRKVKELHQDIIRKMESQTPLEPIVHVQEPVGRTFKVTERNVATGLALLEADNYRGLHPSDYSMFVFEGKSDVIEKIYETTNKIRAWVVSSILHYENLHQRVQMLTFFINTAEECQAMRNFSSANAIVGALHTDEVKNLKVTQKSLTLEARAKLSRVFGVFNPESHYQHYREALGSARGSERNACIPWMTFHLIELGQILGEYPITVKINNHDLINLERYSMFMDYDHGTMDYKLLDLESQRHNGQLAYVETKLRNIHVSEEAAQALMMRSQEIVRKEAAAHVTRASQMGMVSIAP